MNILLDQNIPREVTSWFSEVRPEWNVRHVSEVGLWGKSDPDVYLWAQTNRFAIVTYDEDFGDIRFFELGAHSGIIRLRVWPTTVEETTSALNRMINAIDEDDVAGSLITIDRSRIRIRRPGQR